MRVSRRLPSALLMLSLCGCNTGGAKHAVAEIRDASGRLIARATFEPDGDNVGVRVEPIALPPGLHGIHVHENGSCEAPDFTSAGDHFNPGALPHHGAGEHHAGDLPNIGDQPLAATLQGVTMSGRGHHSLFHKGGTSIVIHRDTDNLATAPSGRSGPRIACGVITPSD